MLTSLVSTRETPAGEGKLTLEGLEHWRGRLSAELGRLLTDMEETEAAQDREGASLQECGRCADALHAMRAMHAKKQGDLELVLQSIAAIQKDLNSAAVVAEQPGVEPLIVTPRHPKHLGLTSGARAQSGKARRPLDFGASPARPTREIISRNLSRQSAILVNSPDPAKRLQF